MYNPEDGAQIDGLASLAIASWSTSQRSARPPWLVRNALSSRGALGSLACPQTSRPKDLPHHGSLGLRIGVTGAQGVGKSSLARALAIELGIPLVEEVARGAQRLGFSLGTATTLLSQAAMWFAQFDIESRLGGYVADRTLLDVVTHSLLFAVRTGDQRDGFFVNALGNATARVLREHYTLMFYLPIEFDLVPDGVRDLSAEFQRLVDVRTHELLGDFGIPYVTLQGPLDVRLEQARRAIARLSPRAPA